MVDYNAGPLIGAVIVTWLFDRGCSLVSPVRHYSNLKREIDPMKKLIALMTVVVASLSTQANAFDVEAKFMATCNACHGAAAAAVKAPAAFNAEAWKPRLAKGMDNLLVSVNKGFQDKGVMPAKGLCFDCTDDNYKALITYMSTPK